jgi:hypothetical protein
VFEERAEAGGGGGEGECGGVVADVVGHGRQFAGGG